MSKLFVVLDRGHGQKGRSARFDPGAVHDTLVEVNLTHAYIAAAKLALEAAGHVVVVLVTGTYDQRHAVAIRLAAEHTEALYIQCHVNAGGGEYALVEYDRRSSAGRRAASSIARALGELAGVTVGQIRPLDSDDRGWTCIDDIWAAPTMCGVLIEPGFIDSPEHAHLWTADGLRLVGAAIADGIEAYAEQLAARSAAA